MDSKPIVISRVGSGPTVDVIVRGVCYHERLLRR